MDRAIQKLLKQGEKAPHPDYILPMLASSTEDIFENEEWIYEIKWDGFRTIAHIKNKEVKLQSRRLQSFNKKYPPVSAALAGLKLNAVLDGEVIVMGEDGKPNFNEAQKNYTGKFPIYYYVFDLLWYNGYNLLHLPLCNRKEILKSIIPENDIIKYSADFDDGESLFEKSKEMELEGIVAKRKNSIYRPGERSKDWLKIKSKKVQDFVIGGWSESESERLFKSLLVGNYQNGDLVYVHHSGGGFTEKQQRELYGKMKKLEIKKKPFVNEVESETPVHWVKPTMIADFEWSNKTTPSGKIRHPLVYIGTREDKDPKEVTPEVKIETAEIEEQKKTPTKKIQKKQKTITSDGDWNMVESREITSEEEITIEGKKLKLVNIEKELWHGITKGHLINYYINIAPYILKYLHNRPLALHVNLKGVYVEGFFLRGLEGHYPKWAKVFRTERKHKKEGKSKYIEWLVCNDLATLVYIINLECIDIHPWSSRITSPNEPDYISIDLDPSDNDSNKVVQVALAAKNFFDKNNLKGFIKTSGKTGMHIFIPCTGIEFGEARTIAEDICTSIHKTIPNISTLSFSRNQRGKKVYIDPSQNDYSDRLAVAYCCRPAHHPTVSTPLDWKELNDNIDPKQFTFEAILNRLKKKGDIWKSLLNEDIRKKNGTILIKNFL